MHSSQRRDAVLQIGWQVWLLPLDLSGMGDPTSRYATAGIALRVSGALKPHHHDKVETPLMGNREIVNTNISAHSVSVMYESVLSIRWALGGWKYQTVLILVNTLQ
jgi:hypothetical protein